MTYSASCWKQQNEEIVTWGSVEGLIWEFGEFKKGVGGSHGKEAA
jgi:hypothetical protein